MAHAQPPPLQGERATLARNIVHQLAPECSAGSHIHLSHVCACLRCPEGRDFTMEGSLESSRVGVGMTGPRPAAA